MSLSHELDKRVRIETPLEARDAFGQPLVGWVSVLDTPDQMIAAKIEDLSAREFVAAAAGQAQVQTKIKIRHRAGIAAKMRVVHGADIYNIEGVLGQDNRTLLLMCSRGLSNG